MSIDTKDVLQVLWSHYKDEQDWQRHNEIQRATFSQILFAISGALIALMQSPQSGKFHYISTVLIFIGIFGILMVIKYRERYLHHVAMAKEFRTAIDAAIGSCEIGYKGTQLLQSIKTAGEKEQRERPEYKYLPVGQYFLWIIAFSFIAIFGVATIA